ncbi:MAG: histidine kinase [Cyclobacteriaceae bacterium]|nr:histidine kinase [Cyclobacteriaceae bacterium]MCH8516230.1 histidine kinase [Cyclobacteriaceae bacterium]
MWRILYVPLFFTLFSCFLPAQAQEPFMRHLTDEIGLPSMEVYSLMPDKDGYIWIGHSRGLSRYDGRIFKSFTNQLQRGSSLSDMKQATDGKIWLRNFIGQLFYFEQDSLHLFEPWDEYYIKGFPAFEIANEKLWIAERAGKLFIYDLQNNQWEAVLDSNDFQSDYYSVRAFGDKVLTFNDQLMIIDSSFMVSSVVEGENILDKEWYKGFSFNKINNDTTLVFSNSTKKVYFLDEELKINSHPANEVIDLSDHHIIGVNYLAEKLWIYTYDGLWVLEEGVDGWTVMYHLLEGRSVSQVSHDFEGNIWISTLQDGIYMIPKMEIKFMKTNQSSAGSKISKLLPISDEELWIGHASGEISVYDLKTSRLKSPLYSSNIRKEVEAMIYDSVNQRIYLCINGLHVLDRKGKLLYKDSYNRSFKTFVIQNDRLYFTSSYSFGYYELSDIDRSIRTGAELEEKVVEIKLQRCKALYYDEERDGLWVGFTDGLLFYGADEEFHLRDAQDKKVYVNDITIIEGEVYAASSQYGLIKIVDKSFEAVLSDQETFENKILFHLCQSDQKLWMNTGKGVLAKDLNSGKISLLTKEDGLISEDIYDIAVFDRSIWIATSKGLTYFPETINTFNQTPPKIIIESVEINNDVLPFQSNFLLKNDQNNLRINFRSINFKSKGNHQFQYRLLGLDTTYYKTSGDTDYARFLGLPPGKYTFEVFSVNEDNVMSENSEQLSFEIKKAWYQQSFVHLGAMLIFLSLIYGGFQLRLKSIKRQDQLKESLKTYQLMAIRSQMNPHFIFNVLNSIQEFILLNEKRQASHYLGRFSELIRRILQMSREEKVSLEEEILALKNYLELEALRFGDSFTFDINIDDSIDCESVLIPSMIIQPFVENAIKHGLLHKENDRKLVINFLSQAEKEYLICKIDDNGIGREASYAINQHRNKSHQSFAVNANKSRLDLINNNQKKPIGVHFEDKYDNNKESLGTTVRLNIPIEQ